MHVCHFCDLTFEGEFFRLMITGLARRGIRVSLVELAPGVAPTWLADAPGASYQSFGVTSKVQYPATLMRLAHFIKSENIDILHTHLYFAGVIGVMTKWLQSRAKVVVMRHHSSVVRLLGWGVHIWADKWMAEKADHVITVSEGARRYMLEVDGIQRSDIDVVYLGFDFDKVAPSESDRAKVRRELGFADDDLVIGYVSTLIPAKGHLQLMEAFKSILVEIPSARLLFVGGGEYDEASRMAAEFEPGKVVFTGFRDDIPACLNAMDLFVQPSLSEAFSRVIIEAMGVGLPVIATRVGGADEVIENGENGILVRSDDPDAIYHEVLKLYRDTGLRNTIAQKGMASVRERFTADRMVEELTSLYNSWVPTTGN